MTEHDQPPAAWLPNLLAARHIADKGWCGVRAQPFNAQILVGLGEEEWAEAYEYADWGAALAAFALWAFPAEPEGWIRHLPSCRRRPGGDPEREYVAE